MKGPLARWAKAAAGSLARAAKGPATERSTGEGGSGGRWRERRRVLRPSGLQAKAVAGVAGESGEESGGVADEGDSGVAGASGEDSPAESDGKSSWGKKTRHGGTYGAARSSKRTATQARAPAATRTHAARCAYKTNGFRCSPRIPRPAVHRRSRRAQHRARCCCSNRICAGHYGLGMRRAQLLRRKRNSTGHFRNRRTNHKHRNVP